MSKESNSNVQDFVDQLSSELGDQPLSIETTEGKEMILVSKERYESLVRCERERLYSDTSEEAMSLEVSPLLLELNKL